MGDLWINLPVANVERSRDFFAKIGFALNEQHQTPQMASLIVGRNRVVVNLFTASLFKEFIGGQNVTATDQSSESLISIGADSPSEVDEIAQKVIAAGGSLYGKPGYKDSWMYGCGFVDPDGHRWNILFMDMAKMPGAK